MKFSVILLGAIFAIGSDALAETFNLLPNAGAKEEKIVIDIGRAVIVSVREEVAVVVVGNDSIVATNIIDSNMLALTGLGAGETNLILIDREDTIFYQRSIKVSHPGKSITVRRAGVASSYQCNVACRPTDPIPVDPVVAGTLPSK